MGATLSLDAAVTTGSRFVLRLPVRRPAGAPAPPPGAAAAPPAAPGSIAGTRVLLADDTPSTQAALSLVLRRAGASVDVSANGTAAVQSALAALRAGQPYDVVLMDVQMPDVSGPAATAMLRAQGYRHPIVALTAHALDGERERCLDAGCDGFATKPIEAPDLVRLVQQYRPIAPAA
jgi:CheY-like chemotaxis protein